MKMNVSSASNGALINPRILFSGLPSSPRLLKLVWSFLDRLKEKVKIDSVAVTLAEDRDGSPPFRAALHLAVPGPDLHSEQRGATLDEAWQKVDRDVQQRLRQREAKRVAARKRQEPRRPSGV